MQRIVLAWIWILTVVLLVADPVGADMPSNGRIMLTGFNSNAQITAALQNAGYTAVENFNPDAAALANVDTVILLRTDGNAAITDFVNNGGGLITEWIAADWVLNSTTLVDADQTGSVGGQRSDVIFTTTADQTGLNAGIGESYNAGEGSEFWRTIGNIGDGVTIYATRAFDGSEAIIGSFSQEGRTMVIAYDWGDSFQFNVDDDTNKLLLNAVDLVTPYVWHGSVSGTWSDPDNWSRPTAPGVGCLIHFDGSTNTTVNHDAPAGTVYDVLMFKSSAGSFTITGNQINLQDAGGIINRSANGQTFDAPIAFGGNGFIIAEGEELSFTNTIALVQSGAAVTITADHDVTFGGVVSGDGGLIKHGNGLLILNAANTYTGGTTLAQGFLLLNDGQALGAGDLNVTGDSVLQVNTSSTVANNINVSSGTSFTINAIGTPTFSGDIYTDTGTLIVQTTDTITLSGNNSYPELDLNAGTLIGDTDSLCGNITNNSAIIFNQSTDGTYAGDMSGVGTLTKLGNSSLVMTGDNTYTGLTTLGAGTLEFTSVAATPGGDVLVDGGMLVGVYGSNFDLTATAGIIAPGHSFGTMAVSGQFNLNGSTFDIEVNDAGQSDILTANTAVVTSGVIRTAALDIITAARQYSIIQTGAGVTADPVDVNQMLSDTSFILDYSAAVTANDVVLTVTPVHTFEEAGELSSNPNAAAVGHAFDQMVQGGSSESHVVAMQAMNQAQLTQALEQIQPQVRQATTQVVRRQQQAVTSSTQAQMQQMQRVVRAAERTRDSIMLADAGGQANQSAVASALQEVRDAEPPLGQLTFFARSLNDFGRVNSDRYASGHSYNSNGADFGLQCLMTKNLLVGGGGSVVVSNLYGHNSSGESESTTLYANAYVSYLTPNWHIDGGLSYGHAFNDTEHPIAAMTLTANGDYDSNIYSGFIGGGYFFALGDWDLEPFANLDYTHVKDDGYTETGAGAMNATLSANATDSLRPTIGLRVSRSFAFDNGMELRPRVSVAWVHELLDKQITTDANILGATFRSRGVDIDRNTAQLGVGGDLKINNQFTLFADYTASLNDDWNNHSINVGVRIMF